MNLKDEYSKVFIDNLADQLSKKAPSFNTVSFTKSVLNKEWKKKELKERMRWIVENINSHLDLPYKKQLVILLKIAPNYGGIQGFIFSDFVQTYGLDDLKSSLNTIEIFTQYSTAEFAIRPFIEKYPSETMQQLLNWSLHKNHHLRRLASEGTRPRLPWAPPLRKFIADPTPSLSILENLKNDDSLYVRKSVANHLNDISKDHPELVLQIAKKWYGKSENTNWIIKHALRTLLKKGNKKALAIFGLNNAKNLSIENLALSKKEITIGNFIHFEFEVINTSNQTRSIRLEYRIDFIKANGNSSGKVFQISEFKLKPHSKKIFKRKQSFHDLSTRKHYPGKHNISVIVNGDEKENIELMLTH